MFKFNFHKEDEEGENDNEPAKKNQIHWYQSEELKISSDLDDFMKNISEGVISRIDYGNGIAFFTLAAKEAMNLLKKQSAGEEFLDVVRADEQHSDLLPGRYEGGLKTWECTRDLAIYFVRNVIEKSRGKLEGKSVLDLGCGSGILGVACLQHGANVTFQDYNKEVLEVMTMPNIFLNCNKFKDRVNFYSGDWLSFLHLILDKNKNKNSPDEGYKYDYIMTSETIYNQENYEKLIEVFKKLLKPDGVIFVAAKTHYFGVGGTLNEFMDHLRANGFDCAVVWETTEGVARKIVKVRARNVSAD